MNFLLWAVYWPVLKFLSLLVCWLPRVRERINFEKKNLREPLCVSFSDIGICADFCFEFSSEGEYQQVASLIDDSLNAGKRLELVFFSPSVEKTIINLAERNPRQVRYLRYPLLSISPFGRGRSFSKWITAGKLILVRYDLFPEFLIWAMGARHELTILWTTFKKERSRKKDVSWLKRLFLKHARKVIYASSPDQQLGHELGFPGPAYDFRMEQIRRRVSQREEKFRAHFHQYGYLKTAWEKFPREKRLVVGNAWPSDLFLLKHLPRDVFVLVVPHQLTPEIVLAFKEGLTKMGRKVLEIQGQSEDIFADTLILNKKGVLCELYADFDFAYVGGGFETSVHSLLEPLVAGVGSISCGPLNHRSTEFDVASSMGAMTEVKTAEEFAAWMDRKESRSTTASLGQVFVNYEKYRKDVISC